MITFVNTPHPYEKTVFENGTRLMLVPLEGVNSVATCVMVNAGSRYETPAINGVSHFLEHMVFKGTKLFPTTEDVNFIERMGGLQNAYTDIDITNYHNKVMASDWQKALELNKELALYPRLEEQYVDKERNVILEEMKRYNDELPACVSEEFQRLLYQGTSLGMRVIGTETALKHANSETLREYHEQMYTPERTVVVVAGNLKSQNSKIKNTSQNSNIKEQVEEWFGPSARASTELSLTSSGLQKSSLRRRLKDPIVGKYEKVTDKQTEPAVSVVTKKDAQQAHLTLGVRTFGRGNDDRYAWSVFNLLFGVSFTSRLFKEIREKRGLCYTVRSGSDNWDDVGYWSIYAGVATEKVQETVRAILDELKKAVDTGVTNEEVAVAKKRLLTMISFKAEDPEFMAEFYGQQELRHQPILTIAQYFKKIEAVTKDDIDGLIRKYVITKHLNLAVVWNKTKEEKLVDILRL